MKQVILLGDSIRMQYQKSVGEKLADIAEVSGPEENGRWSGYTLNSLRFWLPQLPVPDLNLFLDVPIGFVEQSLNRQREGADRDYLGGASDIHEASIAFQKTVRSMYLAETEQDPRFLRIDCAGPDGKMLPPDAIFDKVRSIVDSRL